MLTKSASIIVERVYPLALLSVGLVFTFGWIGLLGYGFLALIGY
jgi:hypothetical protein